MDSSEQSKRYKALNKWFSTPHGRCVSSACADEVAYFHLQFKGERLLQLGCCGDNPWLKSMKYSKKTIISPYVVQKNNYVSSLIDQLPFARDSIDCIIAPFIFEACSFSNSPIDELDRVLKPMGYIIFFGINPLSSWGIGMHLKWLGLLGQTEVKLHSSFLLKKELLEKGYRQCALSSFYYIPPVSSKNTIQRLEFLNEMGKMLWLIPAGFYCLVVQKFQVIAPTINLESAEKNYLGYVDNIVS